MLTYPNHASTPIPKKRSAPVPLMNLENGSEVSAAKKKLVLECDTTPLASSRTCLSTSTLSTPGRMVSTSRIHITRGIQTIRPETTNRYCQVSVARIRKPTTTQHVQTEEWIAPPAVSFNEMGCQTDGPLLLPNTCVATTQTDSIPNRDPVQRDEASCQTDMLEEQPEEHQEQLKPVELDEPERHGTARESITNMLNDFAKQYGIDLQSPAKKKKAKSNSKKKEIEHLQECLANKTYKAMASKVDEKMGQILEQHMAQYGRETVASRERLIRWTKSFIRRQQQQNRAAASTAPSRKIVLVRKIVTPASKRPSVEDKGVQCVAEVETIRITVGTQWQRQKPMVPEIRCAKRNCPATPKNWPLAKTSKEGNHGNENNKENIPPNHQNQPL
ncbi:uncharacterized protein LOC126560803 [Anopheles maculipalpis]|uniref:uncharacterized protein LOC126560803 n=1 Tax=Anopheles maculipalpis TaxID=1496333 RepID=UPI002158C52B|nr:uncharacterized protein LOC126560803 [Anopheles maculipalpis]